LAVERGEVHCWSPLIATYFGREPYITWQKKGYVRVVVQFGSKRDPRLGDVPTIYELMDQYKTPEAGKRLTRVILIAATLGRPIAATPGIPSERLKLLREAYQKTLIDPELIAETKRQRWEIEPLTGEEMDKLAKEVMVQPKEVIERMKWVLGN
jgi:tripartite-type tricarboxylate transporter receptor subunit TctC